MVKQVIYQLRLDCLYRRRKMESLWDGNDGSVILMRFQNCLLTSKYPGTGILLYTICTPSQQSIQYTGTEHQDRYATVLSSLVDSRSSAQYTVHVCITCAHTVNGYQQFIIVISGCCYDYAGSYEFAIPTTLKTID